MSQVSNKAFKAKAASTAILAVTTSSAGVQVHDTGMCSHIRIYNSGSATAYIEMGKASATAVVPIAGVSTGSMPVAPGTIEVFGCPEGYVAAITASGTTNLEITPGHGT